MLKLLRRRGPLAWSSHAGAEQEYFLVDRASTSPGPTSIIAGRTLFGARRPRARSSTTTTSAPSPSACSVHAGRSSDELYKLGVPAKTRHNEVAPGQFEIAPIFERERRRRPQAAGDGRAARSRAHGFVCLLHEKPFAGRQRLGQAQQLVDGQPTQGNLLDPGHTPHDEPCSSCVLAP
jgi:glutamine synthetase